MLELAAAQYAPLTGLSTSEVLARFRKEFGYVTAKVVICAVIVRDGKVLLEKRADDSLWGLPGGWVDVNETPEDAVAREIIEECSLKVTRMEYIAVYSRPAGSFGQPHSSCHLQYLCDVEPGEPRVSHESLEFAFLDPEKVSGWHRDHQEWARNALKVWKARRK